MNSVPNFIPFNRAAQVGDEFHYMRKAITDGHASGNGPFTRHCERLLAEILGLPRVLLTSSCTHALEMTALLLHIRPGDEVIMPSFTFVSTANAFVLQGAKPVFVDIRRDTLNLDERLIEQAITSKTRAIVPVHYGGIGCQMDVLMNIAKQHNLAIIEDNAHGLFGQFQGQNLGTFGQLSTLSFHETKNYSCGEGGALLINDYDFVERAEIIREKGTNRSRFFRGEVDRYTWVDVGSSYLLSDVLAAYLLAQLENRETILQKRAEIFDRYNDNLTDLERAEKLRLPIIPTDASQAYHLFYLLMNSNEERDALLCFLKSKDILAAFHYLPLHLSPMGYQFGYNEKDCPIAEDISSRLVRLPFYYDLSETEQMRVIEYVYNFYV